MTDAIDQGAPSPLRRAAALAPNALTITRLLTAPALVVVYAALEAPAADAAALALFSLGAATDALDGWAARRFGAVTRLGAALDPIADKALIAAALLALGFARIGPELWFWAPAALILGREALVSALRARLGPARLPVSNLGKWKTATQSAALWFLIGAPLLGSLAPWLGALLLWLAAALGLLSGAAYVMAARRAPETAAKTAG